MEEDYLLRPKLAHHQLGKVVIIDCQGQFWLLIVLWLSFVGFALATSQVQSLLLSVYVKDNEALQQAER